MQVRGTIEAAQDLDNIATYLFEKTLPTRLDSSVKFTEPN
jgi:hypothetical protein